MNGLTFHSLYLFFKNLFPYESSHSCDVFTYSLMRQRNRTRRRNQDGGLCNNKRTNWRCGSASFWDHLTLHILAELHLCAYVLVDEHDWENYNEKTKKSLTDEKSMLLFRLQTTINKFRIIGVKWTRENTSFA